MAPENWETLTWNLPLESPPNVLAIGRNVHGFSTIDRYCLTNIWTLNLYGYEATLKLGERELPIRPGYLGLVPPNTPMEYHYSGLSVHIFAHFEVTPGLMQIVPAMQDLGTRYDEMYRRLFGLVELFGAQPCRVTASLWNILWEIVSPSTFTSSTTKGVHSIVQRASDYIDRHLAEPLSVSDLAQTIGVSGGHLSRLFREAYNRTVVGSIKHRRVSRAVHLLERSTLPIKAIAASVGLPDLQQFNKAVRSELGLSPRELRRRYVGDK